MTDNVAGGSCTTGRAVRYPKNGGAAAGGPAYAKAYGFALRVVKICEDVRRRKREFVLSRQLLSSGTSIGANLAEAGAAISGMELSHKASIAYQECQESKYWISLMRDMDYLDRQTAQQLLDAADSFCHDPHTPPEICVIPYLWSLVTGHWSLVTGH